MKVVSSHHILCVKLKSFKNCRVIEVEFQKLWRSVAVEGIDDNKIEEYLEKQGITSMQDQGIKKLVNFR